jgi:hypothetical protein
MADRDVFYNVEKHVRQGNLNWPNGSWGNYSKSTHVSLRSKRAESVPTVKVNGQYVLPTQYDAFKFVATGGNYDFVVPYTYGRKKGLRGQSSTSLPGPYWDHFGVDVFTKIPNVPAKVVSRCSAKVQNAIRGGDFNVGQTLGEMPETLRFIADTFSDLLHLAKLTRGRKWKEIGQTIGILPESFDKSGTFARNWLALQYGWKPMLNDIYSAAMTISEGIQKDPPLSIVRISRDTDFGVGGLPFYSHKSGITNPASKFNRGIEMGVTFTVANPSLYDLTKLGLTNPLSTAWEILPLSFVIDWFIPIGNFLTALTPPMGLRFQHGYSTRFCNWKAQAFWNEAKDTVLLGNRENLRASLKAHKRYPLITFPIPFPSWDPRLNTDKVISLGALAKVILGK